VTCDDAHTRLLRLSVDRVTSQAEQLATRLVAALRALRSSSVTSGLVQPEAAALALTQAMDLPPLPREYASIVSAIEQNGHASFEVMAEALEGPFLDPSEYLHLAAEDVPWAIALIAGTVTDFAVKAERIAPTRAFKRRLRKYNDLHRERRRADRLQIQEDHLRKAKGSKPTKYGCGYGDKGSISAALRLAVGDYPGLTANRIVALLPDAPNPRQVYAILGDLVKAGDIRITTVVGKKVPMQIHYLSDPLSGLTIRELAKHQNNVHGLTMTPIHRRLKRGMQPSEALALPPNPGGLGTKKKTVTREQTGEQTGEQLPVTR